MGENNEGSKEGVGHCGLSNRTLGDAKEETLRFPGN